MRTSDVGLYAKSLEDRIKLLENMVNEIGYAAKTGRKKTFQNKLQSVNYHCMHRCLCVDTIDPWKENRIRYYHPIMHDPSANVEDLPFANPVSAQGGFDDCGCNWVPPAGSTLVVFFENGIREAAYYVGTTWHRDRGPGGQNFGYSVPEYFVVSNGHRKGYLVGPNDESQVFPQWNTESYNNYDTDSTTDFSSDTNENNKITYPNIYGWKTPEKHMIKMVDGNARCDRRWKRLEIQSGCGNSILLKDDHLHYGGQWAHPTCPPTPGGQDVSQCSQSSDTDQSDQPFFTDPQGNSIEQGSSCSGTTSSSNIIGGHPSTPFDPPDKKTAHYNSQTGANPYFKHQNECRPVAGPGTPQNNKIDLPQTGIQFLSISGHTMVMDDSVEEPQGAPTWERSIQPFDFGCNNKYLGVFYIKSATGHSFAMSDVESDSGLRGDQNYIELKSAWGNQIQLNDETLGANNCQDCPPNYAGPSRGIHLTSTSNHQINMNDHMNGQCGTCRKEGGTPTANATKAFVQIISGYGLEMRFNDDNSQQQTMNQWIQITNPQCAQNSSADTKCNTTCGPHFLRFQARPQGEMGIVFLRAGGIAIRTTYDQDIVMVGDKNNNPANKFTYVSKNYMRATEQVDFRYAGQLHILFAEQMIFLMAGRDCPPPPGKKCRGPCLYPVIIARCPITCPLTGIIHWSDKSVSERVFASGHNTGVCIGGTGTLGPDTPCSDDNTTQTINTGAPGPYSTVTTSAPPTNPQTQPGPGSGIPF